jgi:hypothetical protein
VSTSATKVWQSTHFGSVTQGTRPLVIEAARSVRPPWQAVQLPSVASWAALRLARVVVPGWQS